MQKNCCTAIKLKSPKRYVKFVVARRRRRDLKHQKNMKFDEALRLLTKKYDVQGNFNEALSTKVESALEYLNIESNSINRLVPGIENSQDDSVRWKYISVSFYVLLSLKEDESTTISITKLNDIKTICQFIISLGILPNLIPGIGVDLSQRCKNVDKIPKEDGGTIIEQYYRLRGTVKGLLLCLDLSTTLKQYIIAHHFNDILSALCQLCYAPIKKPSSNLNNTSGGGGGGGGGAAAASDFTMTCDFYKELVTDIAFFQEHLDKLLSNTYTPQIMQELMFIYGHRTSPRWLKSAVFQLLLAKLQSTDGVISLVRAVTDSESLDTGAGWKQSDILMKILMTKPANCTDHSYFDNICSQIMLLTTKCNRNGQRIIPIYERIAAMCVRFLYENNVDICEKYFLRELIEIFLKFTKNPAGSVGIVTRDVTCGVSLFYQCFIQTSGSTRALPMSLLYPVVLILAKIYSIIVSTSHFKETTEQIKLLLITYLDNSDEKQKHTVFESFLFQSLYKENFKFVVNKECALEFRPVTDDSTCSNSLINCECLLELVRSENADNISVSLCMYLFEISIASVNTSEQQHTDRKIVAYHLLSLLLTNQSVHSHLKRDPKKITLFITNTLQTLATHKVHLDTDADSGQFQTLFLLVMIVSVISETLDAHPFKEIETLKSTLHTIASESVNAELKALIYDIQFMVYDMQYQCNHHPPRQSTSEYDRAIKDVCDPLIPVRGHGLLTLAKLIKNKDPVTSEKKLYILNICQQHVKCNDSYVYLSAISVLAALGDSYPELVLSTLADEYMTGCKDMFTDDTETRIKLGEVLLRVVRSIGATDAVIKYKSLLLNTFLSCVRDDDHWIRVSSLSNLGELCRVLGYNLGTVVSEVLSCIHTVIATDNAVEARRAAVSVIRMLFVGLECETIVFLKGDILPIYRTLKTIYTSDPDDITRLQAQLALEQLNENIRDFVFPQAVLLVKHKSALH